MRNILLISPHYPPSNLAAVHRTRLFAQYLPDFGWDPTILTVDEKYYEESLDWNLEKLLPFDQKIEKVTAFAITSPRLIGDIGLRAFFQLRERALQIVRRNKIDFVYIPIPSFYVSLIGRYLNRKTGVKFGIDYIDPWVHNFPGSDKVLTRHWVSSRLAKFLEPIAVKRASLITGVAEGYYTGVISRNPKLSSTCLFGSMPYGGELSDHKKLMELNIAPYLISKYSSKFRMIYAGAMLPKAYAPLREIFKVMNMNLDFFRQFEFHFIGTGKSPNDSEGYNIKPLAEEYGLWGSIVYEYPARIPYLDVLVHLHASDGIFILGSTEPHYTPSKVYQAVLAEKPILAALHEKSTALDIIRKSSAGVTISFNGDNLENINNCFIETVKSYQKFSYKFDPNLVDRQYLDKYSAKAVTSELVELLEQVFLSAKLA